MKKIFFLTFLTLAIASFGGTTMLAHAQSTGGDTGTLQAQLQLMKDKLQLLQLQQMQGNTAIVAQPVAMPSSLTISASDAAALNSALTALASTLVNLQSAIQSNPQFMTQNGPVVARSLAGIENSLAAVLVSMQSASAGTQSNVMALAPSAQIPTKAGSGSGSLGSQAPLVTAPSQESLLPSVDSLTQPAASQDTQSAAVAVAAFAGRNRLPAIIVGIILLAMIAILIWGRGNEDLETSPVTVRASAPKGTAPVMPVPPSISFVSNQNSAPSSFPASPNSSPSPLASAMNQQNQRKNA